MKRGIVLILAVACAALAGCRRSGSQYFSSGEVFAAEDEAAGTSISSLFPAEVDSIEVTFDFYPSEVTRVLNTDEIAAVTEWALALEVEQAPLDETETPNNYAGGAAWHFNVNNGELTLSYADYGEGAIFINNEWYAVKRPSDPPVNEYSFS